MDHPLRSDEYLSLRRDIYELLKNGYSIPRQSNIVFVCGGNKPRSLRRQFQRKFPKLLPEFEFFEPEFAMKMYWTLGDTEPFDITTFEELIAALSHSIVIFPEAPGSIAETGYFSAKPDLANNVLLVLDTEHLKKDSFISVGPAKRIDDSSKFGSHIEFSFKKPDFQRVAQRLKDRRPPHAKLRTFEIKEFSEMSSFELFALIQVVVYWLNIATIEDIEFILRGLFKGTMSPSKVKQISSILVGSKRLKEVSAFGHLQVNPSLPLILNVKDGAKTRIDVVKINLSSVFLEADEDFRLLLGG